MSTQDDKKKKDYFKQKLHAFQITYTNKYNPNVWQILMEKLHSHSIVNVKYSIKCYDIGYRRRVEKSINAKRPMIIY